MKFAKVSAAAIEAACRGDIEPSDVVLLGWLWLHHADYATGKCIVSHTEIARGTKVHRSTVVEQKKRLVAAGLLLVEDRRGLAPVMSIPMVATEVTSRMEPTSSAQPTSRTETSSVEPTSSVETTTLVGSTLPPRSAGDDHLSLYQSVSRVPPEEGDARAHTRVADPVPEPPKPQPPPTDNPRNQPTSHDRIRPLLEFVRSTPHAIRAEPWVHQWHTDYYRTGFAGLIETAGRRVAEDADGMTAALGRVVEKAQGRSDYLPRYALSDWLDEHGKGATPKNDTSDYDERIRRAEEEAMRQAKEWGLEWTA